MRNLLIVCVVLVVGMLAVNVASAADKAIPQNTLKAMGLDGMQSVSDARGDAIRGKGVLLIQAAYASNPWKTAASGQLFYSSCCPSSLCATTSASVCGAWASSSISVR